MIGQRLSSWWGRSSGQQDGMGQGWSEALEVGRLSRQAVLVRAWALVSPEPQVGWVQIFAFSVASWLK